MVMLRIYSIACCHGNYLGADLSDWFHWQLSTAHSPSVIFDLAAPLYLAVTFDLAVTFE